MLWIDYAYEVQRAVRALIKLGDRVTPDGSRLGAFFGCRNASVGHPHVAVSIDVDAVWPHEHAAAKAPDLFPCLVEEMDRVCLGAEAPGAVPGEQRSVPKRICRPGRWRRRWIRPTAFSPT